MVIAFYFYSPLKGAYLVKPVDTEASKAFTPLEYASSNPAISKTTLEYFGLLYYKK